MIRSQANSRNRQQPPSRGWSRAVHWVQPQPLLHYYLNPRAGFWKGKRKLLLHYRPPQAGPRSNTATVADIQPLTAAKCKQEACQNTLRPGLLLYTSLPPQHFCTRGVAQQPTQASVQAAEKHPGNCTINQTVCEKQELKTHYPTNQILYL